MDTHLEKLSHGDVVLSTIEAVAPGHGEEPAGDSSLLWYVEALQPHVAIPTILGQPLSRFG